MERDLDEVYNIAALSLKEKYPKDLYLSIDRAWKHGFFVADVDGKTIGFICGIKEQEDISRVLILAVHPLYRNCGIGSELLKKFIEVSSNQGVTKVTLEVRTNNTKTILFYQKRGFQVVATLDSFYTDGEDGYKMIRYL